MQRFVSRHFSRDDISTGRSSSSASAVSYEFQNKSEVIMMADQGTGQANGGLPEVCTGGDGGLEDGSGECGVCLPRRISDQAELERAGANDVDQVMSRPTRRSGPNRCAAAALAEVAGARVSYVRRPERLGACWRLRQSKAVLSALTRRIHERMTEGVAHGRVTRDQRTFPVLCRLQRSNLSERRLN